MSTRRTITVRTVALDDANRTFDLDFWQDAGPEARVKAAWDMVNEARRWKGKRGLEPRLQRSVLRVEHRGG